MRQQGPSTGTIPTHARGETGGNADPFEQHLPTLALRCLRLTGDREQAAALAGRVLRDARRKAASADAAGAAGVLHSLLREASLFQPFQERAGMEVVDGAVVDTGP
jgi:hypothetical protein